MFKYSKLRHPKLHEPNSLVYLKGLLFLIFFRMNGWREFWGHLPVGHLPVAAMTVSDAASAMSAVTWSEEKPGKTLPTGKLGWANSSIHQMKVAISFLHVFKVNLKSWAVHNWRHFLGNGKHTWKEIKLNPTWVYQESKGTMRTPLSRASNWALTCIISRSASRSL